MGGEGRIPWKGGCPPPPKKNPSVGVPCDPSALSHTDQKDQNPACTAPLPTKNPSVSIRHHLTPPMGLEVLQRSATILPPSAHRLEFVSVSNLKQTAAPLSTKSYKGFLLHFVLCCPAGTVQPTTELGTLAWQSQKNNFLPAERSESFLA